MIAFAFLGVLILASALRVITASRIVHAALYLALCFTGVAGIFLLLGADFLAATQVLIYVGAVTTLIIFAIMLSSPPEVRGEGGGTGGNSAAETAPGGRSGGGRGEPERGWVGVLAALAALGFVAAMGAVYRRAGLAAQAAPLGHTTARLGGQIFTTYAVPFEVASVVLLAALVGAIYLSVRVPGGARVAGRPGGPAGAVGGARREGEGGANRGTS
jgi:NADH:ubiquinone oxidoreductase subunit 6 (subunit J)